MTGDPLSLPAMGSPASFSPGVSWQDPEVIREPAPENPPALTQQPSPSPGPRGSQNVPRRSPRHRLVSREDTGRRGPSVPRGVGGAAITLLASPPSVASYSGCILTRLSTLHTAPSVSLPWQTPPWQTPPACSPLCRRLSSQPEDHLMPTNLTGPSAASILHEDDIGLL